MMVLVAYDVSTESHEGRRRLRRVARVCVSYGQRVQNSVFECLVDPAQLNHEPSITTVSPSSRPWTISVF